MFAIAGIVLLLIQAQLGRDELVMTGLSLPLVPLLIALGLFGLAIDLKLRKSQLVAAPQLVWALALAVFLLLTAPSRVPIALALFVLIAQGVQSFRALATVALTLIVLALCLAVRVVSNQYDDPTELVIAIVVAAPLAVALFERKRSLLRGLLLLVTLTAAAGCVIVTQSRGGRIVFSTVTLVLLATRWGKRGLVAALLLLAALWGLAGAGVAAPPSRFGVVALLLAAAMSALSFKLLALVWQEYAGDSVAAVARTWARLLAPSLAGATVGLLYAGTHQLLFWVYAGLAGALYQAARAHDPKLRSVGILGVRCL